MNAFVRTNRRARATVAALSTLLLLAPLAAQAEWYDDYERKHSMSPVDVLSEDGRFGLLLTAVGEAGLVDAVEQGGFTLFAPTDEAFLALGDETLNAVLADKELLTRVLLYHLTDKAPLFKLARRTTNQTLEGSDVVVVRDGRRYSVNGIPIVDRNIGSKTARIHVIEEVLIPPPAEESGPAQDIIDVLERDGRFTTLLAALDATDLDEVLEGEGRFTLFAPTDEAFAKLPEGTVEALLGDLPALSNILLYHVLLEEKKALPLLFEGTAETAQGGSVTIRLENWRNLFIDDAPVANVNLMAPNGVIHVIEHVLTPPAEGETVLDVLEREGYTTLLTALEVAGLEQALLDLGPVTIFAPTNEAFAELGDALNDVLADVPLLRSILLYHVVLEEKPLLEVILERRLETVQGSTVRSTWFFGPVFINKERVVEPNITAPDAVVHGIDGVLIPPGH